MANTLCRVEIEHHRGYRLARLFGEVDISNVEQVESELETPSGRREVRFVIDLDETEYFDSAGIRLLFSLAMRLRARRQELHVIARDDSIVRRVLEITDFARLVPVHASISEFLSLDNS